MVSFNVYSIPCQPDVSLKNTEPIQTLELTHTQKNTYCDAKGVCYTLLPTHLKSTFKVYSTKKKCYYYLRRNI